jgi:hypothetical protein
MVYRYEVDDDTTISVHFGRRLRCGIQRSAWSPARHQNRPRSGVYLRACTRSLSLRQNRQNQLLFEVPYRGS